MAKDDNKKALLEVLDQIGAIKKKLNELDVKRREVTSEIDNECTKLCTELETLYEKKRIIECDMVDSMVYE